MTTLAIEMSSARGSIALLKGSDVASERSWENTWKDNQQLFGVIREVLSEADVTIEDVSRFATGLGPGSFSGTRIAISTVQGFARPDRTAVIGVSSGEALAADVFSEFGGREVAVIGDARRQQIWHGLFREEGGAVAQVKDWALYPVEDIASLLENDPVVVTPEWERLAEYLDPVCGQGIELVRESRYPSASAVARLAAGRSASEILEPIYLHPPVFVKPKFGPEAV